MYILDLNEGLAWCGFQVPSGWGHPFRVESASDSIAIEGISWFELWRHIALPPTLFNVTTCVLYINHSENVY